VAVATKVLLVEDSKFLRIAGERALNKAGYLVVTASDGEQALTIANEQLPDIILLDMLIPKVSGQDVLRALKKAPATNEIPVVVVSSLSQANADKLVAAGAAAYFEKSTLALEKNSDLLTAVVERVLGQVKHQREVETRLRELAAKKAAASGD
jgi:CheY-like chemotaxis protein